MVTIDHTADPRIGMPLPEFGGIYGRTPAATRQAALRGSIPTIRVGRVVLVPMGYVEALRNGEDTSRWFAKPAESGSVEAAVEALVKSAPALTPGQIDRLSALLSGTRSKVA